MLVKTIQDRSGASRLAKTIQDAPGGFWGFIGTYFGSNVPLSYETVGFLANRTAITRAGAGSAAVGSSWRKAGGSGRDAKMLVKNNTGSTWGPKCL